VDVSRFWSVEIGGRGGEKLEGGDSGLVLASRREEEGGKGFWGRGGREVDDLCSCEGKKGGLLSGWTGNV
jgi:hypothetical protein